MTSFNDKVFLLSNGEVGFSSYSNEGRIYGYYKQGLINAYGSASPNNGSCSARIKTGSVPTNIFDSANGRTSNINSGTSTYYYVIEGDYTQAYWGTQSDGSDKEAILMTSTVKFTCNDKRCVAVPASTGYIFLDGANSQTKVYQSFTYWWMRSPRRGHSNLACRAHPLGDYNYDFVDNSYGCAPACAVI